MADDVLKGQWKQVRGKAKEWWGKLTDDDLNTIDGKREQLVGKLQERYGYTKEKAARDIDERLKELEKAIKKHD
jgi:uncharacterized protein YjbJ (UPF0337 family)